MTTMTTIARRLCTAVFASGALLLGTPWAQGQTAPAAAASSAGGERDFSISDRVKKDAASPLYWIRLNAQKPDGSAAKAGPKITEVRPARAVAASPAPATAPSTGTASNPATSAATNAAAPAGAGGVGVAAAAAGNAPPPAATAGTTSNAPALAAGGAASDASPPASPQAAAAPGAGLPSAGAGLAAAGLAGGSATSATDAARAATVASAAEPDEEEDEPPLTLLKAGEPEFSAVAMRRLRKGSVQVKFDVLPDGHVANVTVVQTTNKTLNEAAVEAVNGWLFKPVRSPRSAVVDLGFDLDS